MANAFGNPITDWTLKEMAEFINKEITAVDRARVAIHMKNADMKDTNARTYVENLRKQYCSAKVGTLCLVYNATGNTMTLVGNKDWDGHIGQAPYPIEIQNGQWGAFLHAKESGATTGSVAGVVYRGKDPKEGKPCDYALAWSNSSVTSVWTEARENDHYGPDAWDYIRKKLGETRYYYRETWQGCLSTITTGSDTSPVVEATFTSYVANA